MKLQKIKFWQVYYYPTGSIVICNKKPTKQDISLIVDEYGWEDKKDVEVVAIEGLDLTTKLQPEG